MITQFKSLVLFILIFTNVWTSLADSGVRGSIKNTKGEALSFASIIIKGSNKGTMANEDGLFEIALAPGTHTLIFQYLSHKTLEKQVTVQEDYQQLNIVLEEQSVSLAEVKFSAKQEDPSYTIMRKAISMARLHALEVSSYTARTYVKGSGKVSNVSGMMKLLAGKKLEKELGLKLGQTYVLESINDISFTQPNVLKEKIVSARSNFPPRLQQSSGNVIVFARTNFYNPKVIGNSMISPLSPHAFAYYRFVYEGMFTDKGVQVNKIRLTPKTSGEDVFEGTINIIEDTWALHSLDLRYSDGNGSYTLKQLLAPFNDVWMPVYMDAGFDFDAFGIEAQGRYVTNVRNYDLKVNPKYHQQPVVIDEKIDKAEAKALKTQKVDKSTALKQQQLTRKQLSKIIKNLEKEDKNTRKAQQEDVSIARDYTLDIDSLSTKRSNDFWNTERQVPLTTLEVQGYVQADSMNKANEEKVKKDSIKNLPKFKWPHLLTGHTYNYGKRDNLYGYPRTFSLSYPGGINAVEGYYVDAVLKYTQRNKLVSRLELTGDLRYSINRDAVYGTAEAMYIKHYTQWGIKGGQMVYQVNEQQPITALGNVLYTMLGELNYMKLYQKNFINLSFRHQFSPKFTFLTDAEFAQRNPLDNSNIKPWIDVKDRTFEPNIPVIAEANGNNFASHHTLIWQTAFTLRPWAKTNKFNGREFIANYRNPIFRFRNRMTVGGDAPFHKVEAEYEQTFDMNTWGDLHVWVQGGGFIKKPSNILDYKHFNGGQILLRRDELFNAFRNLPYYQYSTAGNYVEAHVQEDFRSLLLTQSKLLRLYGLKESLFVNYLHVPNQQLHYTEVGYGLVGIGKFFGLEVVSNFYNNTYSATVLRIKFNR